MPSVRPERGVQLTFNCSAANQPHWEVKSFLLHESISEPYDLTLVLACETPSAAAFAMLGKHATLTRRRGVDEYTHGIVVGVASVHNAATRGSVIRVRVAPALRALGLQSTTRIFSNVRATDVAKEVLETGLRQFGRSATLALDSSEFSKLECVTQHRESDLDFVQRLLAEHGAWYFFERLERENGAERVVLTDSNDRAPAIGGDPDIRVIGEGDQGAMLQGVFQFGSATTLSGSSVHVRQFDWTHPELYAHGRASNVPAGQADLARSEYGDVACFDYARPRYRAHDAQRQALLRLERSRCEANVHQGRSNVVALRAGHVARIEGAEYLILNVNHVGSAEREAGNMAAGAHYANTFSCIARSVPFRPRLKARPVLHGPQTAMVVDTSGGIDAPASGREGNDIATDEHGRVRVRFAWNVGAAKPGSASAFIRVAQSAAGAGWGSQFIPRVGTEVLVQFEDGNPDRPLIVGALYNGLNAPPYAEGSAESGVRTSSSVDRTRYNAWSFVDTSGREVVRTHAAHNLTEFVLRDHHSNVRNSHTQTISEDQSELIAGNASLTAAGRTKNVAGSENQRVDGARSTLVGGLSRVEVEATHSLGAKGEALFAYGANHTRQVSGHEHLEVQSDKLEHVIGRCELTTDTAHVLTQGDTQTTYRDGSVTMVIDAEGTLLCGPASCSVDAADTVKLVTPSGVLLQVGSSKVELTASGVSIESPRITISVGASSLELTPVAASFVSTSTHIEASAVCQIRGLGLVQLN